LFDRMSEDPELRSIPVVFLTASTQRSLISSARNRAARALITKPFSPSQLRVQIEAILDGAHSYHDDAALAGLVGQPEPGPETRGSILIIEDGQESADYMADLLVAEAYETILCRT